MPDFSLLEVLRYTFKFSLFNIWICVLDIDTILFRSSVLLKETLIVFNISLFSYWASLVAQIVKNPPAMWETWVQSLSWEDPLEKGKAPHSSILAWRIPWTAYSMGSQRVGQDWARFTFTFAIWIHHFDYPFVNGYLVFFPTFFTMMNSPTFVSKLLSHARKKQTFSTEISMKMMI